MKIVDWFRNNISDRIGLTQAQPQTQVQIAEVRRTPEADFDDYVEPDYDPLDAVRERILAWDGMDVSTLPIREIETENPGTFQRELAQVGNVPLDLQGEHDAAPVGDYKESATILAIDQQGQAAVLNYVEHRIGAEGWSCEVLRAEEAVERVTQYQASHGHQQKLHLSAEAEHGATAVGPIDLMLNPKALEAIQAQPGHSYRGEIVATDTRGVVLQHLEDGTYVSHRADRLIGASPHAMRGELVDIRYPVGTLGLVAAANNLDKASDKTLQIAPTQREM